MSRFLFAWELGGNYGHLIRDLPVAELLRAAGHQVLFAASDTRTAAELLTPRRYSFVQAPMPTRLAKMDHPPANYTEMLLEVKWGDQLALLGLLMAWLDLFALARPDTIVADHAPAALLSARIAGIPCIAMGSGFEIPPACNPLPSIRPWESIPSARLLQSEALVLHRINTVNGILGGTSLKCVADIFPAHSILTTFAELDHYGPRDTGIYIGSIHGAQAADDVSWPQTERMRVLAYLRPGEPATEPTLAVLAETNAASICVAPGADRRFTEFHARPNLSILPQPVRLSPLLAGTDVLVCYAGAGMIAEALLAGVPLLLVPQTVEQYLAAARVAALGAGILVQLKEGIDAIRSGLATLLADQSYRLAAQRFAARYRDITPERAAADAAAAILAVCNGTTLSSADKPVTPLSVGVPS